MGRSRGKRDGLRCRHRRSRSRHARERTSKEAIDLTRNQIPVLIVTVIWPEEDGSPVYRIRNVGTGSAFGFWMNGITSADGVHGDAWELAEMKRGTYLNFRVAPDCTSVKVADLHHGERQVPLPERAQLPSTPPRGIVYELEGGLPPKSAFNVPRKV